MNFLFLRDISILPETFFLLVMFTKFCSLYLPTSETDKSNSALVFCKVCLRAVDMLSVVYKAS